MTFLLMSQSYVDITTIQLAPPLKLRMPQRVTFELPPRSHRLTCEGCSEFRRETRTERFEFHGRKE